MGLTLSEKHGVNPTIPTCFYCQQDKNEVALLGRLPGDVAAPMRGVIDFEPCTECAGHMVAGIIMISIKDGEDDREEAAQQEHVQMGKQGIYIPNPYRTGGWWVIKREAFRRVMVEGLKADPETIEHMLELGWCFLADKICTCVGLELPVPEPPAAAESDDQVQHQEEG